jgi:hypothetical protein
MRMSKGGNCCVTQWCNLEYSNCVIIFVIAMVLITNDAMTYFEYHPKCIEAWTLGSSVSGIAWDGHFVLHPYVVSEVLDMIVMACGSDFGV